MGFLAPSVPSPPPPPPLPPAANPQTIASAETQAAGAQAKKRAAAAAGQGFSGTDLTKPDATGAMGNAGTTAKATALGGTS